MKGLIIPLDLKISIDDAIKLHHKHPVETGFIVSAGWPWTALKEPEKYGLGHKYIDVYNDVVQHYFHGDFEKYLREGWVEWRGGEGVFFVVTIPIDEIPYYVIIEEKHGIDPLNNVPETDYRVIDKRTDLEEKFYSCAGYFSPAGNGTYCKGTEAPAHLFETESFLPIYKL